ncbi:hypothetical protein J3U99_12955 [Brucella pituitosa]|uniref:Uncharacterized protein n=1 Tax=Brucella pituitosa TaxID=571256 RepID=A0A643F027_9HYPH|nr:MULTISPECIES: hypothetical protein [Brucella]PQZ50414.1 hypothetical protein CQZ90_07375 [Ochrobactrum sp. MYb19]PRA55377.1 hypothetical protein CQ062_10910 [Ochrobactrum sp. MYb68]PRA68453.1 hypothetical protein CQ053_02365 [Ochrobactrum sp. MYb18]PRA74319.1 hypothetical protein CQ049_13715 [Brucella thiophenivorans]PRA86420.1 hypothetical protein CQ054_09320 [Ochrobactrum sp. MYb29]PRA90705.1 hypothetical protein CQ051_12270 [Ochrobactrum sp. MYb14]PRA96156.1 hypothetical protein CQ052_
MPFKGSQYYGTFTPEDLQLMQVAYNRSCALLERCPTTHEAKDDLARAIIRTFQSGECDPEKIAAIAARVELMRS